MNNPSYLMEVADGLLIEESLGEITPNELRIFRLMLKDITVEEACLIIKFLDQL
jgi:hypothetical protein